MATYLLSPFTTAPSRGQRSSVLPLLLIVCLLACNAGIGSCAAAANKKKADKLK